MVRTPPPPPPPPRALNAPKKPPPWCPPAITPAVRSGLKIEFLGVGSRPYQVVLRVSEPPRALRGDRTCLICGVIVRGQDHEHWGSITHMIRHYVARRAQVTEGHPHNAE